MLTSRAVGASLLLFFAIVAAVIFAGFEVALAAFILSVIVAPNHWYRGAAGDQSTSMEHPGGF